VCEKKAPEKLAGHICAVKLTPYEWREVVNALDIAAYDLSECEEEEAKEKSKEIYDISHKIWLQL